MALPISTAEAKDHLRILGTDEDGYIAGLIRDAFAAIESDCGLVAEEREASWSYASFADVRMLPRFPVDGGSVAIAYLDSEGAEQDWTGFRTVALQERTSIAAAAGAIWPGTLAGAGAVTVTATIGHADPATYPADGRRAALLLIGHFYANREVTPIPEAIGWLLQPFRGGQV